MTKLKITVLSAFAIALLGLAGPAAATGTETCEKECGGDEGHPNNGWGNGDQGSPGKSGPNNRAENPGAAVGGDTAGTPNPSGH